MKIFLTVKNYRCFVQPVTIEITKGFTSFVGLNNAGKSAIMRFLLEFRPLFQHQMNNSVKNYAHSIINSVPIGNFSPIHVMDPQEIFSNLNENPIEFWFDFIYENVEKTPISPDKASFRVLKDLTWIPEVFINDVKFTAKGFAMGIEGDILKLADNPALNVSCILDLLKLLSNTLYIGPFRNAINIGTKTDYIDIQIGQSFISQFKSLKTGINKKNSLAISKLTEEITKIFSFEKLEINPSDDNQTLHITINSKPYMQHELGSGLMQFILVLANVLVRRPAYVLIDEPELNLHPRLQLDFLTTLGMYVAEGVWFSTHSIGLARSSSQSVYSVLKKGDGDSEIRPLESIPRLGEFLGEMSFSSHHDLGFEKVLLVEGSTDVPVFQQFLRKLSKDHKVVILPLNGNINSKVAEQLEEVKRITPNLYVIIDSERKFEGDVLNSERQSFVDICKSHAISCHVLTNRATENYFSDNVVKQVFGSLYKSLTPYELLKEVEPCWSKAQNFKLAREMSIEELAKTDFWEFLKAL